VLGLVLLLVIEQQFFENDYDHEHEHEKPLRYDRTDLARVDET
jgi:hypothetical protein